MKKHEAERLIEVIRELAEEDAKGLTAPALVKGNAKIVVDPKRPAPLPSTAALDTDSSGGKLTAEQLERIYLQFKRRLLDELPEDPVLLQLIATRPEIILEMEPRVVVLNASTLKGRIALLISRGWFASARATGAVRRELARTGTDPGGGGGLSDTLSGLLKEGFLVREGEGWAAAPNIKITEKTIGTAHGER